LEEIPDLSNTYKPSEFILALMIFIIGIGLIHGVSCNYLETNEKQEVEEELKYGFNANNHVFEELDSCSNPFCFIYQPNPFSYITYEFEDTVDVCRSFIDYETCVDVASGVIESSLWNAMIDNGLTPGIIDKMEEALASSVDFYHTQKGDEFKLIFERKYIKDRPVSIGQILGAYYKNDRGEHYSIYYQKGKYEGFYDQEGHHVVLR